MLFTMQAFVSTSVLTFAMYMLFIGKDPGVYLPIITGITSYWMPAPTFNTLKKKEDLVNDIEQPLLTDS
jgi:hypothetical protein